VAPLDTPVTRRRHAVQYGDWYYRRLTVHRIGSYTMLPLFAAEWSLGQNLLRVLHAAMMLASDAGVVWTGVAANSAGRSRADAHHHRAIALGSIGLSTAGTLMMWFWRG
jgi:hypothetical protein